MPDRADSRVETRKCFWFAQLRKIPRGQPVFGVARSTMKKLTGRAIFALLRTANQSGMLYRPTRRASFLPSPCRSSRYGALEPVVKLICPPIDPQLSYRTLELTTRPQGLCHRAKERS